MMKRIVIYSVLTAYIFSSIPNRIIQVQGVDADKEIESGAVVCPPDVYLDSPGDCLPTGPSEYLKAVAELGLTIPQRPLPASKPDPNLTQLPYSYFRLDEDVVPFISGPAGEPTGQSFAPGFVYVSYIDRVDTGHGIYYMLQSGGWIPGKGSRIGEYSRFQGLEFHATPQNAFAWPLPFYVDSIPVHAAPGYNTPLTDRLLYPYIDIVPVYDTQSADGVEWNMIGPNEWVEARIMAMVTPDATPPDGVTTGRWVDVNLAEQTLAVYNNSQLVFATVIASGLEPFWTRPGLFQIYSKKETETMRNNDLADYYYLDNVPWTMYFDKASVLAHAFWISTITWMCEFICG
jgi:hypothetical protein